MNYWQKEQIKQQENLLTNSTNFIEKQLGKIYTRCAKNVVAECLALYLDLTADGELNYAQLMQYDRLFKLNASINQQLNQLGLEEINILDSGMIDLFLQTGELITGNNQWALINRNIAEEAIKRIWCNDGKSYSDRIWLQKTQLQQELQDGVIECVVQGKSHKQLNKRLRERFGVAQSSADRIARTELNYIQNQAAMRGYLDAGYTQYQFITATDNRTCDECGHLNRKIFSFADAQVGVNYPPIHPNCRSNVIGYKE